MYLWYRYICYLINIFNWNFSIAHLISSKKFSINWRQKIRSGVKSSRTTVTWHCSLPGTVFSWHYVRTPKLTHFSSVFPRMRVSEGHFPFRTVRKQFLKITPKKFKNWKDATHKKNCFQILKFFKKSMRLKFLSEFWYVFQVIGIYVFIWWIKDHMYTYL